MNYHNITPAKYFYDMPQEKKMAELGRKQLIELKECTDLAVCDSKFNESELKEIGYKNTCVVPIPTKIGDLLKLRTKKIREKIKKIITVGRIARNKCIEDVIKVFSEYHKLNQNSRLDIIGNCDNKQYAKELCDLVNKLNINESVFFRGSLTPKQLAWYYSNADVYLCMSEHEGFCVPILEALAFNLKVIAARNTALIETVGKFGALVDKTNYANVAMLIDSNHKYNNFKFDDKNKYDINLIFDGC